MASMAMQRLSTSTMPFNFSMEYMAIVQIAVQTVTRSSTVATRFSLCVPLRMAHSPMAMGAKKAAGSNSIRSKD